MVRRWRLIGHFPILYNPHPPRSHSVLTPATSIDFLSGEAVDLSLRLLYRGLAEKEGAAGKRLSEPGRWTAMQTLRIVTSGISGGRSLTRPFRDARRFPSTRLYPVPRARRTPRTCGRCPSFKGHFLSRRAEPDRYDSQLASLYAEPGLPRAAPGEGAGRTQRRT
jgi:hypothetical protein